MIPYITLKKDFVEGQPDYHFELNQNFVQVDRILGDIAAVLATISTDVQRIRVSGLTQDVGCTGEVSTAVRNALQVARASRDQLTSRLSLDQLTGLVSVIGADETNPFVTLNGAGTDFVRALVIELLGTTSDLDPGTSETVELLTNIDPTFYDLFPFWSYGVEFPNNFGGSTPEETLTIVPLDIQLAPTKVRATITRSGATFTLDEIPIRCLVVGVRK